MVDLSFILSVLHVSSNNIEPLISPAHQFEFLSWLKTRTARPSYTTHCVSGREATISWICTTTGASTRKKKTKCGGRSHRKERRRGRGGTGEKVLIFEAWDWYAFVGYVFFFLEMDGRMRMYGSSVPERLRLGNYPSSPSPPRQQRLRHRDHHQHRQHQEQELQQAMKIPVVYYLCKDRHLEHPHFMEVPISSTEGLYLRDFIDRLNLLRGKGMAKIYSWSCKRSYKNGFVWHDLSEDDLVLPAQGNEYVIKGSELLNTSPLDRPHQSKSKNPKQNHLHCESTIPPRNQVSSPSCWSIVVQEGSRCPPPLQAPSQPPLSNPSSREEDFLPSVHGQSSYSGNVPSPGTNKNSSQGSSYKVYKPTGAADASTQTDESKRDESRARDLETHNKVPLGHELEDDLHNHSLRQKEHSEIGIGDISPPPASSSTSSSGGKTDTLGSLIKADAQKMNGFRILEEEDVLAPMGTKHKATNMLMQLITCGSISVKDHHSFRFVHSYKPRISYLNLASPMLDGRSMALGELDCIVNGSRFNRSGSEEKEYFSGSIIETKKQKDDGTVIPSLTRSSSYNADSNCKSLDIIADKNEMESGISKCLPETIKLSSCKHSKNEISRSPLSGGSRISSDGPGYASQCTSKGNGKRFTDASSTKGPSMRLESFQKDTEKVIKFEERLTSGARVIIQSRAHRDDSEGNSTA